MEGVAVCEPADIDEFANLPFINIFIFKGPVRLFKLENLVVH